MHVQLLTTHTTHHLFFARQLAEKGYLHSVVVESRRPTFRYPTVHGYEDLRNEHERVSLLGGEQTKFEDLASTIHCVSVNDGQTIAEIERIQPDVILLCGTGIVSEKVISIPTTACINFHGGDPEEYRGLDSHMWAIYHRDFANLLVAMHHVVPDVDAGDLISIVPVPVSRGCRLYELRGLTTRIGVEMALDGLQTMEVGNRLSRSTQFKKGRYYSAMPAILKEQCIEKFENYTNNLP